MTKIHDLRSFIEVLEEAGQLVRIKQPVSLTHELADVAATLVRQGGGAPFFESVEDSQWPVFASGVANQKRAALALGCREAEVTGVMSRVLEPANGLPPVRVDQAHWQANVRTGDEIDVSELPIPTHSCGDGGAFITAMAAMTAHINIKQVIVVDQDINIYDPADVFWALTNRVDWRQDVFTVPSAQGHEMDPTADNRGVHTKIGIDATYKRERREYGERVSYKEMDLNKYLGDRR